jgi:plasmid replication initiation protein
MEHKNLVICKANKIVEAGYKLSLNEQRVVLACIGQVNSTDELLATDEFELSAKDFAQIFSVSNENAYQALIDVTKSLFNRYLVIENPYPENPKVKKLETRWISSIKHLPDDGKVMLRFAQDMLPYLSELKGSFTRYKLEHVGKMTTVYGIRLYELIAQWQGAGKREVELDWLKSQLQLDESYDRMNNFKARVIDPAIEDINKNSNFNVSWSQRKTGRRISHLLFEFDEKKLITTETKKKKNKSKIIEVKPIDNLDFYADVRKRFGDAMPADAIPADMIEKLKSQGRW